MESLTNNTRGSALTLVLVLVGTLFIMSMFFFQTTVEQRRHTQGTLRGLQVAHLAEIALNRAWGKIQQDLGHIDATRPDSLAALLRAPFERDDQGKLKTVSKWGQSLQFGKDTLDADGNLSDLVKFLASSSNKVEFEVSVTVKPAGCFAFPRDDTGDPPKGSIPGVDIPSLMKPEVRAFLEGKGVSKLPVVSEPMDSSKIDTSKYQVENAGGLALFGNALKNLKLPFPTSSVDVITLLAPISEVDWGKILTADGMKKYEVEKFGELTFVASATIRYSDGTMVHRNIEAAKEFKVVDIMPPAPLYSFFVGNSQNNRPNFNTLGADLFINNFPLFTLLSKFIPANLFPRNFSAELNFPGLIRVNYADPDKGDKGQIGVEVGLGVNFKNPIFSLVGNDVGLIMQLIPMNLVPISLLNFTYKEDEGVWTDPDDLIKDQLSINQTAALVFLVEIVGLNLLDEIDGVVGDVFSRTLAVPIIWAEGPHKGTSAGWDSPMMMDSPFVARGLLLGGIQAGIGKIGDILTKISQKAAGKLWEKFLLGKNFKKNFDQAQKLMAGILPCPASHLFGFNALSPTLTQTIEGPVQKEYLRLYFGIIGLTPRDRFPLETLPPIPFYMQWKMHNNYVFNFFEGPTPPRGILSPAIDPADPQSGVPNLYYSPKAEGQPLLLVRKASYFYKTGGDFISDLTSPGKNWVISLPDPAGSGKDVRVLSLNGIVFIDEDLGSESDPFNPFHEPLYIKGKGMIVVKGNIHLGCDILCYDTRDSNGDYEMTTFSLMAINGGALSLMNPAVGNKPMIIEGSVYTENGIFTESPLFINGNWVTDVYCPASLSRTISEPIVVNYDSLRMRPALGVVSAAPGKDQALKRSLASLHPEWGKFIPDRYLVRLSPQWSVWRAVSQ